ncbi:hypothetical protein HDU76_006804 [Blyttiomyces sp. JEL0837]|nr:hypothetical protein HDU76_006804 [Blyttiomyces sp. JEL0837]
MLEYDVKPAQTATQKVVSEDKEVLVRQTLDFNQDILTKGLGSGKWTRVLSSARWNSWLISQPTASELTDQHLHPALYLFVHRLGSLTKLAELLGVPLEGLDDICNIVWRDRFVQYYFQQFSGGNDDTPEDQIQSDLQILCAMISNVLEAYFDVPIPEIVPHRRVIVGGFMALHEYEYIAKTDLLVEQRGSGKVLFGTEIKTCKTYTEGQPWYGGSRGPQVLAALVGHDSPTFLVTPKHWRLFVHNEHGNIILTAPVVDDHDRLQVCAPMGEDFVKALTICLLTPDQPTAETPSSEELVEVAAGGDASTSSSSSKAGKTTGEKSSPRNFISSIKKRRQLKFSTGVNEAGEPIWQEITVWTREQVAEFMEREGERLEKLEEERDDDEYLAGSTMERQVHSKASSPSPTPRQSHFVFDGKKIPIFGYIIENSSSEGSESDWETDSEDKSGDEEIVDTFCEDEESSSQILGLRQDAMTKAVNSDDWNVEPSPVHDGRFIVTEPTASKLDNELLHSKVYFNLQPLGGFDQLAEGIGVPLEGLDDICNLVWSDENVQDDFLTFTGKNDNTREHQIQFDLLMICMSIERILCTRFKIPWLRTVRHGSVLVGGFMALPEYDIRSKTDFLVKQRASGKCPQVLAALYGYNSVSFLVTPKQWKLFVENEDRDAILTMPVDDDPRRLHLCRPMGEDFVKALTICLLTPDQTTSVTPSAEEAVAVAAGSKTHTAKFPVGVDEFGHTVWTPEQVAELLKGEKVEKLREEQLNETSPTFGKSLDSSSEGTDLDGDETVSEAESRLIHKHLHPAVYSNLQPGGFIELAERLGVPLEGLDDICDLVWSDRFVQRYFKRFMDRINDTRQDQIESDLLALCQTISSVLETHLNTPLHDCIYGGTTIVGGFMALPQYDFISLQTRGE